MIPAKFAPVLFAFLLSGLMSLIVSSIATVRAVGIGDGFLGLWMSSWASSWVIAFPAVLVLAPIVRRLVAPLTRDTA